MSGDSGAQKARRTVRVMKMEKTEQQKEARTGAPDLLYHYTTQEGLLGIIKKQKIWASHLQYLNDASEGQIFTKLLLDEFNQRATTESEDNNFTRLMAISQLLGASEGQPESKIQGADKEILKWGLNTFFG
jgi:hypothetical protein